MSPPTQPRLDEIRAYIPDDLLDELLRALRACDRKGALVLIAAWQTSWPSSNATRVNRQRRLSHWLRDETRLHVEGGRFQHALTLVERYATLPVPLNEADATALAQRLGQ